VPSVLYGGSVNAANAKGFLVQQNVGGLLVGGASLIAKDFNQIINM
jgi:triosephosphate isomerase